MKTASHAWSLALLLVGSTLGGFALADCSGSDSKGANGDSNGAGGEGSLLPGAGGTGASLITPLPDQIQNQDPVHGKLNLGPSDAATLNLTDLTQPASLQLDATFDDGSKPTVVWYVDNPSVAQIDANGLLQTVGLQGGVVNVYALAGSVRGEKQVTVQVAITDANPNNVGADVQAALKAGGSADSNFRWLYPYDKTVFPLGLQPPTLQFGGTNAAVFYVSITGANFTYSGFHTGQAAPSGNPGTQLPLPANLWDGATNSTAGADPLTVKITKADGNKITGPLTTTWTIAKGKLKGLVYYNTYSVYPGSNQRGAVLRIAFGSDTKLLQGGCTVCHSVNANGTRLVAGLNWGDGANPNESGIFSLDGAGNISKIRSEDEGRKYSFGALSPDGKWLFTNGNNSAANNTGINFEVMRGITGSYPSSLYNADTGAQVETNLNQAGVTYASTPAFSFDGKMLAFNRRDQQTSPQTPSKNLALLDFDDTKLPGAFSNLRDLATASRHVAAWPAFLPDNKALVYHDGDAFDTDERDFYTGSGTTTVSGGKRGNIRLTALAGGTPNALDALNGIAGGKPYLPYDLAPNQDNEKNRNYEPTVIPVAVGGYYWVIFTSRRIYGNTVVNLGQEYSEAEDSASPRKKLWVAAIDVNYPNATDPSHPAFYLPGQELTTGNMRAFAALEPCRADGATCDSGVDCCGGFCRQSGIGSNGKPALTCGPPPAGSTCANEDEKCTTAGDCCNPQLACINDRCARSAPILR